MTPPMWGTTSTACTRRFSRAQGAGYGTINLDPFFFAHYAAHHQAFEAPGDEHWNGVAHGVAADAIRQSGFLERSLQVVAQPK